MGALALDDLILTLSTGGTEDEPGSNSDSTCWIEGKRVVGAFETYEDGVRAGAEALGVGPFLVRSVHRPDDDETLIVPALTLGLL